MKRLVIDCMSSWLRTALLENGELKEIIIEEKNQKISIGNIYVGTVKKILPSQFAFIDLGDKKHTFLYLNDKKEESLYKEDSNTKEKKLSIKNGQEIVVQVVKEANGNKGAVVTAQLSFTGKYVVLLYGQDGIFISKKIDNEERKKEIIRIAEKNLLEDFGLIMRTNCKNADENEISKEIKKLIEISNEVVEKGKYIKAPSLLYEAENETLKMINDIMNSGSDEIIFNDEKEFENIVNKKLWGKNYIFYDKDIPVFDYYSIESQIDKALHNKIWLKSGGFIIIDETEACTIIDVNSGKFTGKSHNQTILKTNIEAAKEISKQIRLRNLSGMIIIDFIDMTYEEDKKNLLEYLNSETKKDRINTTVVGITQLGLVQLTRKKIRKPLSKVLNFDCPCCGGTGKTANYKYLANKIQNQIVSIFSQTIYNQVSVSAGNHIINELYNNIEELNKIEIKYSKKIVLNSIQTQRFDYYNIEKHKL